jgi:predicted SAM-dependent methyltransferase
MQKGRVCIIVGCGSSPSPGWLNYDGSPSIILARYRWLCAILDRAGFLEEMNRQFISFARSSDIHWADATKHIPVGDASADVLYSSHMLEHLDRDEVRSFLAEAYRVLKPEGIIRIAVPDLRLMVQEYYQHGDGNKLIARTFLAQSRPIGIRAKLKWLLITTRACHRWMYDVDSLSQLLADSGFREVGAWPAGSTSISGECSLNLRERENETLYIEARK